MPDFDSDPGPIVYRCAVPDHVGNFIPRLGKRLIRWFILREIPELGLTNQQRHQAAAFESWARNCGLEFEMVDDARSADVLISAARGERNGFDRAGGVLALAQLPGSSNHVMPPLSQSYDLDEDWSLQIQYLPVSSHESGHTLGISHGPMGSLMQPLYDPKLFEPQAWDIREAQARYGPPKARRQERGPSMSELVDELRKGLETAIAAAKKIDELAAAGRQR